MRSRTWPVSISSYSRQLFNNSVNLVYGTVSKDGDGYEATIAGYTISVDRKAIDRHPGIDDYLGKEIVIGIRPGTFEHARIATNAPDRTITVTTDVN